MHHKNMYKSQKQQDIMTMRTEVDPGPFHFDEDFIRRGRRERKLPLLNDFQATWLAEPHGAHRTRELCGRHCSGELVDGGEDRRRSESECGTQMGHAWEEQRKA